MTVRSCRRPHRGADRWVATSADGGASGVERVLGVGRDRILGLPRLHHETAGRRTREGPLRARESSPRTRVRARSSPRVDQLRDGHRGWANRVDAITSLSGPRANRPSLCILRGRREPPCHRAATQYNASRRRATAGGRARALGGSVAPVRPAAPSHGHRRADRRSGVARRDRPARSARPRLHTSGQGQRLPLVSRGKQPLETIARARVNIASTSIVVEHAGHRFGRAFVEQ